MRCGSRLRQAACGLLLLPLLVGGVRADEGVAPSPLFAPHAALATRTSKTLAGLFAAARKKGFEAVADAVAARLIHFDADHAEARSWLGYKRAGAAWLGPDEPVQHKSSKTPGEAAFRKRCTDQATSLARSFWRMLDKAPEDLDEEARRFVHEDVAVLAPEDPRLIRERTHELVEGQWLTLEARKARETWAAWQGFKIALDDPPAAEDIDLHPLLEPVGNLIFKSRIKRGDVRVWGTCPRAEAELIAYRATTAAKLFAKAFGLKFRLPKDLGFIVVETEKERRILAQGLELGGIRMHAPGYDIPGTNLFVTARWQGWPARIDTGLRFMLHRLYDEEFGGADDHEWASQGVSVLLTYMTTSTFYTVMGWNDEGATMLDAVLLAVLFDEGADWGAYGRNVMNKGALPTIEQLEPQGRRDIWVTDLLACYIYAYYIVVVHDDKSASFYRRIGKGERAADAVKAEFGCSMDAYHARIKRWLNDYRKFEEGESQRVHARGTLPRQG